MIPVKHKDVTWTDEQWQAIYEDNKNIIVSAGAGSGKTAVLTERVIRKLKDGVDVNKLLILSFTKAAAGEMADRVRKKIKKIPELKEQLNLLDSAYITTFDSFALSVVKRYHYLINVSPSIGIIDSSIIDLKKEKILDDLFLEKYKNKDEKFLQFIKTFCVKDDKEIRKYILNISNKLDLLSNKREYLSNYLDNYFASDKIDRDIELYIKLIQGKIDLIRDNIREIGCYDGEFSVKLEEALAILLEADGYDDIVKRLNVKLPNVPRGSDEGIKVLKTEISDTLKEIKNLCVYEDILEIKSSINSTYDTVSVIVDLILDFTERIMQYKRKNNAYEFNDIAIMAINIVKDNEIVREELRNYFDEIMIDEYQDTNDLQEEFIEMISNNNVYMVGDIKQSIYRFRNANPYIFKSKYDGYSLSDRDMKIDLNKNFRSRNEVIDNINVMFNLIMNDNIGGADYLREHQMVFGNGAYLKDDPSHSNDMDIYQYGYDKEIGFTKEEVEAFIVAFDIVEKYKSKYQVFDKDLGVLRNVRYDDFAVIMDRATSFDLYKKIFNYFGIPLAMLKDEKMNDSEDIYVISNLLSLIVKIKKNVIDTEFKYFFVSVMRSFLVNASDEEIFLIFDNNSFKDTDIYKKCLEIAGEIDYRSISNVLEDIITKFDFYEGYIKIGNVHNCIVKLDKLRDMAINLEGLGYDVERFSDYLRELLEVGYKIEYKVPDIGADAVKIMTIHKSKGLEYPICYFSGLYKSFNISDLKDRFILDKDYGIIVPYFKEGIAFTIYKELLRDKYLKEEISEKIRLFYVALTRAREKMILVNPVGKEMGDDSNVTVLVDGLKLKYRSIADMINSVSFRIRDKYKNIDIEKLGLSNAYNNSKVIDLESELQGDRELIEVKEIEVKKEVREQKSFSKKSNKLIGKDYYDAMKLGSDIHSCLEFIDLKNPDYGVIDNELYLDIIKNLLSQDKFKNIKDAKIYQEYEFVYVSGDTKFHGIIDLMLEYDDYIDIIDYKLKNVSDDAYKEQLKGYYNYIKSKTNKRVNLYLYSLLEHKFYDIDS